MDHRKHSNILISHLVDHAIRPLYDLTDGWIPVLGNRLAGQGERAYLTSASRDTVHHSRGIPRRIAADMVVNSHEVGDG